MKPDTFSLLDDLTAAGNDSGEALIRALHRHRRRKTRRQALVFSALSVATLAAGIRFLPRESPPPTLVAEPVRSPILTQSELLDSFGDQPIALVTWPDGRQQLLTIARAPLRVAAR
jgi:hypothetical protein